MVTIEKLRLPKIKRRTKTNNTATISNFAILYKNYYGITKTNSYSKISLLTPRHTDTVTETYLTDWYEDLKKNITVRNTTFIINTLLHTPSLQSVNVWILGQWKQADHAS